MTGKLIGAEEAERIGLANRVAPPEELDAAVDQLVGELLACAPIAVGLAKRVMDASARPALAADARARGRRAGALRGDRRLRRGHRAPSGRSGSPSSAAASHSRPLGPP